MEIYFFKCNAKRLDFNITHFITLVISNINKNIGTIQWVVDLKVNDFIIQKHIEFFDL
jgi:hypothetical protein